MCGKSFLYQRLLQNHEVKHSDDYSFKCDTCPMEFKLKGDLTHHKHRHSSRDWSCLYLDYSYLDLEERFLYEHCRGKHGHAKYKCRKCGCDFVSSHRLSVAYHLKPTCKVVQEQAEWRKAAA